MIKGLFIAPSYQQARYWADQWGFKRNEWSFLPSGRADAIQGLMDPDFPAYVCGSGDPIPELWTQLKIRGFEVFDAEDVNFG